MSNSHDRSVAAKAIVRRLLSVRAMGVISTHDFVLTDIAREEHTGKNLCMESTSPENPLSFDYKLKEGIATRSNALAIMAMAGL